MNISLRPTRAMSRPAGPPKMPSVARAKRRMAKAHLSTARPPQPKTPTRPSIAEIIDNYHDTKAKTIRGKRLS
jgi:hypothetical protein